jgi:hypothetical protein
VERVVVRCVLKAPAVLASLMKGAKVVEAARSHFGSRQHWDLESLWAEAVAGQRLAPAMQ